jgi:hypothetical protein
VAPETGKVVVVNEDLFAYLRDPPAQRFDCAFYDIWQSDGLGTYFDTVRPLLALSKGLVKTRPVCWNESVMAGQLVNALMGHDGMIKLGAKGIGGLTLERLRAGGETIWEKWPASYWRENSAYSESAAHRWLGQFLHAPFFTGRADV